MSTWGDVFAGYVVLVADGRVLKSSDGVQYYYDGSGAVGLLYNGNQYVFRKDIQGNIIAVLDSNGTVVVQYWYDAWGNHKVCDVSGNEITDMTHIGHMNAYRYRGYYYDRETGLYYLNTRYYDPETGRFIQPADVSNTNPKAINGLNLYSYANNNPIGIVYSSSNAGGSAIEGMVVSIGKSNFSLNHAVQKNTSIFDPNFLGNWFAHNENMFSTGAGIVEGIRRFQGLGQLEALSKISKILMHTGYWLNVGLSAYNNFTNEELSLSEQWVSFSVDTIHNTGQTIGSYFLGGIPYAGPFLAIGVPIAVDYIWSGELCIFGFDIDVKPILVKGKTFEKWVKDWVNSWFE